MNRHSAENVKIFLDVRVVGINIEDQLPKSRLILRNMV
jgi:2-methylisocitrate lyase-like PEP mutase family enzyme